MKQTWPFLNFIFSNFTTLKGYKISKIFQISNALKDVCPELTIVHIYQDKFLSYMNILDFIGKMLLTIFGCVLITIFVVTED